MGVLKNKKLRFKCLAVLLVWIFLLLAKDVSAQTLDYTLRETIPIPPSENWEALAVRDMDGDGQLDIVVADYIASTITVLERDGGSFVSRFTISEPSELRAGAVAEVDGDGLPEILSGNIDGRVAIWEATGNNTYALRYTEYLTYPFFGEYIENAVAGDSDGNGQKEFLIALEGFTSLVLIVEAVANNTYTYLDFLPGTGGHSKVAGTPDLDGDGAPETVLIDDNYGVVDSIPGQTVRITHVYENRSLVFRNTRATTPPPELLYIHFSLGDTDNNGLGEIIGQKVSTGDLRILESAGSNNWFVEVDVATQGNYFPDVRDVDNDGQEEFLGVIDNGSGQLNILTIATRIGNNIIDIYNSGSLFQAWPDTIPRAPLAIGDTNSDGNLELAVTQGDQLHILEQKGLEVPIYQTAYPYIKYYLDRALNLSSGFEGLTRSFQLYLGGHTTDEEDVINYGASSYDQTILGRICLDNDMTTILDTYVDYFQQLSDPNNPLINANSNYYDEDNQPINYGPYRIIRILGRNLGNWWNSWDWKVDTGAATELILYALEGYQKTQNEDYKGLAILFGDYILRLQDTDGGIRYGPRGMYHDSGPDFFWNLKSSEQNERVLYALEALYQKTSDSLYQQAARQIKSWLKEMYDKSVHLYHTSATFNGTIWEKSNFGNVATDVMAFAPLELMFSDPYFGATQQDRDAEVDAMFAAIEARTAFLDGDNLPQLFRFSVSQTGDYGSVEWSSQMALAYLRVAQVYELRGEEEKKQEYLEKYNVLVSHLDNYFTIPGDDPEARVAPYASYFDDGSVAGGVPTGTGYDTFNCQAALASAYYAFAKAGYDPTKLGGGVEISDSVPPDVTITSPQAGDTVSKDGFTFTGTAEDASGIAGVHIYVYDYSRLTFTVYNELAAYNSIDNTWSFAILPGHLTSGGDIRLYAVAKDQNENWSDWHEIVVHVN